jgi:hypothetical protein
VASIRLSVITGVLLMAVLAGSAVPAHADVTLRATSYKHGTFSFNLEPLRSSKLKRGVLLPGRAHLSKRRLRVAASRGGLKVGRRLFDPMPPRHLRRRGLSRFRLRLKLTHASKLRWPPPVLSDPTTVSAAGAPASGDNAHLLNLSPSRDYVVRMPPGGLDGGLTILGGHNVVLIGGEIKIPMQPGNPPSGNSRRGLYLKGQTGTAHVEGVLIHGPDLSEGINLDESLGAVVQIQNVRVQDVHARDESGFSDNHPDVLQTWAGPAELLVDRLSGSTDYQGLFLTPEEYGPSPREVSLSQIDLRGASCCYGYLLWQEGSFPIHTDDVWITPHPPRSLIHSLWPSPAPWGPVSEGTPPGGEFVPAGVAGSSYVSPGYQTAP